MSSPLAPLVLLLSLASAAPAPAPPPEAQAPAVQEAAPSGEVQVPRRIDTVAVPYPEAERAAGRAGEVALRLTLDEGGQVTESVVVRSSASPALDEAARGASLLFRFEPARVGGQPVACQIELVHTFEITPPPPPAEPPTPEAAAASAPADAAPPAPAPPPRMETTVTGRSDAEGQRQSAEAVKVVSVRRARARSADMGQVLAGQEGVEVRRTGGLGSSAQFSLNGLTDDQVRFFLDGVPLELAGYPFGVANVPVNVVDSVQLYRGVVPVRYGADALGGAVNLTSAPLRPGLHAAGSLQGGAFGTWRLTLGSSYQPGEGGPYARAHLFADTTDNDWAVDVTVPDAQGTPRPVSARRFHDGYRALGGGLELGVTGRPWAKRLVLRLTGAGHDKELQHNLVMSGTPYGEARYGASALGAQVFYEQALGRGLRLDVLGGYGWQGTQLEDVGEGVYNWRGERVREAQPGEIGPDAIDQSVWQHTALARANLGWTPAPGHALRLAVAPTQVWRAGEDRRPATPSDPDALAPQRTLGTLVTGLEYEVDLLGDALELVVFGKDYLYAARAQLPRDAGGWERADRTLHALGAGAALRLRLGEPLYLKASYERASRLPRADELFGNGVLVEENLRLTPERSHNVNLGLATVPLRTRLGTFRAEASGFARLADDLILLTGRDRDWSYQNVYAVRVLGVDGAAGWSSPGGLLSLDANATLQDLRNVSDQGAFADYRGMRLPNRPRLLANATARVSLRGLVTAEDELSPFWSTRYVHGFFRHWEGVGDEASKDFIAAQLVHAAGVGYRTRARGLTVGLTAELENLADARVYDFFGVQRAGRAGWLKATFEL